MNTTKSTFPLVIMRTTLTTPLKSRVCKSYTRLLSISKTAIIMFTSQWITISTLPSLFGMMMAFVRGQTQLTPSTMMIRLVETEFMYKLRPMYTQSLTVLMAIFFIWMTMCPPKIWTTFYTRSSIAHIGRSILSYATSLSVPYMFYNTAYTIIILYQCYPFLQTTIVTLGALFTSVTTLMDKLSRFFKSIITTTKTKPSRMTMFNHKYITITTIIALRSFRKLQ